MKEYAQYEFELDRNESIVIGDEIRVANLIVGKETVETVRSITELAPDVTVETIVQRTVPIARVGVDVPSTMTAHRGELYNAILGHDADRLLPLFQAQGATYEDCKEAARAAKRDIPAATALLAERFGPPDTPATV